MVLTNSDSLMAGPLVAWFASCIEAEEEPLTYESLVDGTLIHNVIRQMKLDIQHSVIKRSEDKPEIRLTNLTAILRCLQNYIEVDLGYMLLVEPNISKLANEPTEHVAEMELLLKLLISCSVLCPNNHIFTTSMMGFDTVLQEQLKDLIDEVICKPGILFYKDMLLPEAEKKFNEKHIDNSQLAYEYLRKLQRACKEYVDEINLMKASAKTHNTDESKEMCLDESILATALPATPSRQEIPPQPMRRQGKTPELKFCGNYADALETCQKELFELRFKNEALESELKKTKITCNDKIDALLEKADRANRLEADVLRYQRKLEDFETCRSQLQEVTEEKNKLLECQQLLVKQISTLQKTVMDQSASPAKIVTLIHGEDLHHPDANHHFIASMEVEEINEKEKLQSQVNELPAKKAENTSTGSETHVSSANIEICLYNNDDDDAKEAKVAQKLGHKYGSNIDNKISTVCICSNEDDKTKGTEVARKLDFEYGSNNENNICKDCKVTILNLKQKITDLEDEIEDKNYESYMMGYEVQKLRYKCDTLQQRNNDLERVKLDLENFSTTVMNEVRIHTLESQDRFFMREREYQQMVARLDQAKTLLERKLIDSYDDICKGSSRRKRESLGANIVRKSVSKIRRVSELFTRSRKSSNDSPSVKETDHDLTTIDEFGCSREEARRMSGKIELGVAWPEPFVSEDFPDFMQKFELPDSSTPAKFNSLKDDSLKFKPLPSYVV